MVKSFKNFLAESSNIIDSFHRKGYAISGNTKIVKAKTSDEVNKIYYNNKLVGTFWLDYDFNMWDVNWKNDRTMGRYDQIDDIVKDVKNKL